ncbi:ATP-binding protein [Candidatus Sumerlaeota bacterium]|nr:ATP-binding protein [Candidatus Sumerlaeota bacterium]
MPYKDNLYQVREEDLWVRVAPILERIVPDIYQYDGKEHSRQVNLNINKLIKNITKDDFLTDYEYYLLACCSILHDIGKIHNHDNKFSHGEAAAEYLINNPATFNLRNDIINIVVPIIKLHCKSTSEFVEEFKQLPENEPTAEPILDSSINLKKLAIIFRASDMLDICSSRTFLYYESQLLEEREDKRKFFSRYFTVGWEFDDNNNILTKIVLFPHNLLNNFCQILQLILEYENYTKTEEWPEIFKYLKIYLGRLSPSNIMFDHNFDYLNNVDLHTICGIRPSVNRCINVCSPNSINIKNNIFCKESNTHLVKEYIEKYTYPDFIGRDWIINQITDYIKNRLDKNVIYIRGEKGTGKSSLLVQIAKRYENTSYHFCSYDDPCSADINKLIFSLAAQFYSFFDEYKYHIEINDLNITDANLLFEKLIINPLKKINREEKTILIAIDALEEASRYCERNMIAPFVADIELFKRINDPANFIQQQQNSRNLPRWIKFIVTSTPDNDINYTFNLAGIDTILLSASDLNNKSDIRKYIDSKLNNCIPNTDHLKNLSDVLLNKSCGLFIYIYFAVKYIMEEIENNPDIDLNVIITNINNFRLNDLYKLYEQYLTRRVNSLPEGRDSFNDIIPLMQIFIAYQGNLNSPDIDSFINFKNITFRTNLIRTKLMEKDGAFKAILVIMGSLFDETVETVRFHHKSVRDWLIEEKNHPYFIDIQKGHLILSEYYWKKYSEWNNKKDDKDAPELAQYLAEYLPYHLAESEQFDKLNDLLLNKEFLDKITGSTFSNWSRYEKTEWNHAYEIWIKYLLDKEGPDVALICAFWTYFEAFFWWGEYIPINICDKIISLCEKHAFDENHTKLISSLKTFHSNYVRRRVYNNRESYVQEWKQVEDSLSEIQNHLKTNKILIDDNGNYNYLQNRIIILSNIYLAEAKSYLNDPNAHELMYDSIKLLENDKFDDWSASYVWTYLADYWFRKGDEIQSEKCCKEVYNLYKDIKKDEDVEETVADMFQILGDLYWKHNNWDLAFKAYQLAIIYVFLSHIAYDSNPDEYTIEDQKEHMERAAKRIWEYYKKEPGNIKRIQGFCDDFHSSWFKYYPEPKYLPVIFDKQLMEHFGSSLKDDKDQDKLVMNNELIQYLFPPVPIRGDKEGKERICSFARLISTEMDQKSEELLQ